MHLDRSEAIAFAKALGAMSQLVDIADQERRDNMQRFTTQQQEHEALRKQLEGMKQRAHSAENANKHHAKYAEDAERILKTNVARADYIIGCAEHAIESMRGAEEKYDGVKGLLQNLKAAAIEIKENHGDTRAD